VNRTLYFFSSLPARERILRRMGAERPLLIMLTKVIEEKTAHEVGMGKELVDEAQDLVSYLCNFASESAVLVTMYKHTYNSSENVSAYTKTVTTTQTIYDSVKTGGGAILGGVAFFHVRGNASTPPNGDKDILPVDTQLTLKFKLISFHALGVSTDNIHPISYRTKKGTIPI
jgi:hypothetical protein